MMSWSPDGKGEPEPCPLEVAWESSVRSGRDPNAVVDAAGPEGFGFRCFSGRGLYSLSTVAPAPVAVVGASGMEPATGGNGDSSSSMSGRVSRPCFASANRGNLPTSLIAPISHLVRSRIVERKESWCFIEHWG
jgi:hypothetical protein